MSFAIPSLVTGALLATGVTLSPLQIGAYTYTGLDIPDPIVGEYSATGLFLPKPQIGELSSNQDVHLPLLLIGDYRNEVTRGVAIMGATAMVQMVSYPTATGTAVTTSPSLAAWNPNANAGSSAVLIDGPTPGQVIFIGVTSTGAFSAAGSAPTIFWEAVGSSAIGTGGAAAQRVIAAMVTGTAVANGVALGSASYHVSASSMADIISGIQFVQDFWDGWAFNLNTAAPSTYENFKFNSFTRIGKDYYGCNDAGIYLLGGDLDGTAQIDATITTGTSNLSTETFGGDVVKHVPHAYISAKSPEAMTLVCRVEGQEYSYQFRVGKDTIAPSRVDIGKGLRGTFWQFELTNQNGADFEIDSLAVLPVKTSRRI